MLLIGLQLFRQGSLNGTDPATQRPANGKCLEHI